MGGRLSYLDGVRGFAILLVLVAHVLPETLTVTGPLGVQLFFVLSGYLITTLLVSEWGRHGRIELPRFFIRRALRLFPALLVMLALYLGVLLMRGDGPGLRQGLVGAAVGLTYLMDLARAVHADVPAELGHLWSLSVEEHFYVLWPLVVGLALRRRGPPGLRRALGLALAVSLPAGLLYAVLPLVSTVDFFFLPTAWIGSLVAGAYLALAIPHWHDRMARTADGRSRRVPAFLSPAPVAAATLALLGFLCAEQVWISPSMILLGIPLTTLVAAGLLARITMIPGLLRQALEAPLLVRLGQISYGGYLLHHPLILLTEETIGTGPGSRVLAVAAALVLAQVMFRFVEAPVLRLGSRWAPRSPTTSARRIRASRNQADKAIHRQA